VKFLSVQQLRKQPTDGSNMQSAYAATTYTPDQMMARGKIDSAASQVFVTDVSA